jgi:hypothetical protein
MRALIALSFFVLGLLPATAQTPLFSGRPIDNPPITKNIVSDYGGHCNGDYQTPTLTVSITSGTKSLTVFSNSFTGADVGKPIFIFGADVGANITASISGTTMTVTAVSGGVTFNQRIVGAGVIAGTTIVNFISVNEDGTGTYVISPSQTVGSESMVAASYLFTTITAVGSFSVGQQTVTIADNANVSISSLAGNVAWGTDDAPAFASFNTFGRAAGASPILLNNVTNGGCQILTSGSGGNGSHFADGIQNLTFDLNGGKLSSPFPGLNNQPGAFYYLGAFVPLCNIGIDSVGGCSARINSVSAGATSVTLTSASFGAGYASRFTVGNYMVLTGFDMQGLWKPFGQGFGYPPNPYFYDYVIITNVNAGTGVISFDRPLVNSYLSTWPLYDKGGDFGVDEGGPATAYALTPAFNTTVEYRNGTLYQSAQQTTALGVSATYRNITIQPAADGNRNSCPYPSRNITWTVISSDFSYCRIEVDKIVVNVVFNNSSVFVMEHQSASPNLLTTTNVNFGSGMTGTPKNWFDTGSTVPNILAGTSAYGHTTEVNLTNTNVGALAINGATSTGPAGAGISPGYSMTTGLITIPNTQNSQPWAVPGTNLFWTGAAPYIGSFRVTGVTQDGTNTYVQTNLAGGFPAYNSSLLAGGTKLNLSVNSIPKFTCTGCTGSVQAANLNSAPAGAPLFSYYKETFDGSVTGPWPPNSGTQVGFPLIGNFISATFSGTKAYTGTSGTLNMSPTGQFIYTTVVPSTLTSFNYDPFFNLKTAIPRTMTTSCSTPTSCSTTGAGAGDTPTTPAENVWMTGTISPFISANISGESSSLWPSVTVTITADQGVVLPYLLRRDIDRSLPANDNRPMYLDIAA